MSKAYCSISKEEFSMIMNNLEKMHRIFWSQADQYEAGQIRVFLEAMNRINEILVQRCEKVG